MNETLVGDSWLVATLAGDSELSGLVTGVHQYQAPQGATFPYIVLTWLGGFDVDVVGGARVWHDGVWLVKGVDRSTSFATLAQIDSRIDALLQAMSGTVAGGTVYSAVREAPFRDDETVDGVRYLHLGGRYRLTAQSA